MPNRDGALAPVVLISKSQTAREFPTLHFEGAQGSEFGYWQTHRVIARLTDPLAGGWGAPPVVPGSPFDGGNTWEQDTVTGYADIQVESGQGTLDVAIDGTDQTMYVISDGGTQPLGAWDDETAPIVFTWKVDPLGSLADADPNTLEFFTINGAEYRPAIRYHLGDAASYSYAVTADQGLILRSGTAFGTFVPLTITAGTVYRTRFQLVGDLVCVRHWAASADEPLAWTSTLTLVLETGLSPEYQMGVRLTGNLGMKLWVDEIITNPQADAGTWVRVSFTGDGARSTFDVGQTFSQVRIATVDGIVIPNVTDDGRRVTFDRAPAQGAAIDIEVIIA